MTLRDWKRQQVLPGRTAYVWCDAVTHDPGSRSSLATSTIIAAVGGVHIWRRSGIRYDFILGIHTTVSLGRLDNGMILAGNTVVPILVTWTTYSSAKHTSNPRTLRASSDLVALGLTFVALGFDMVTLGLVGGPSASRGRRDHCETSALIGGTPSGRSGGSFIEPHLHRSSIITKCYKGAL